MLLRHLRFCPKYHERRRRRTGGGGLKEVPAVYTGEASHYGIRVLFRRDSSGWQPLPNDCSSVECLASTTSKYPSRSQWRISLGGRYLGTVAAHTPGAFQFYSQIGLQDVDSRQKMPVIGELSDEYSGSRDRRTSAAACHHRFNRAHRVARRLEGARG
jgi:hypothetical protein